MVVGLQGPPRDRRQGLPNLRRVGHAEHVSLTSSSTTTCLLAMSLCLPISLN